MIKVLRAPGFEEGVNNLDNTSVSSVMVIHSDAHHTQASCYLNFTQTHATQLAVTPWPLNTAYFKATVAAMRGTSPHSEPDQQHSSR